MNKFIKKTQNFDYSLLDPETKDLVMTRTAEIKILLKQTGLGIIEIGKALIDVKERIVHGNWLTWLETEFGLKERSAQDFMRIAENEKLKSANFALIANFQSTALRLLFAQSAPEDAQDEALASAEAGEMITYTRAKEMIAEAKEKARAEAAITAAESIKASEDRLDAIKIELKNSKELAESIRRNNQELSQVTNMKIKRLDEATNRLKALEIEKAEIEKQLNEIKAKPSQVEVKEVVKEVTLEVESEAARLQRLEVEAELAAAKEQIKKISERSAKTEKERDEKSKNLDDLNKRMMTLQKRLAPFEDNEIVFRITDLLTDAHANMVKAANLAGALKHGKGLPKQCFGIVSNIIAQATGFNVPVGEDVVVMNSDTYRVNEDVKRKIN